MQVAKWGNSLAVRLPAAVVEALKVAMAMLTGTNERVVSAALGRGVKYQ